MAKSKTLNFKWSDKHIKYMANSKDCSRNIAEGSIRSGKTTDDIYIFSYWLKRSKDKLHLATASTQPTAKLIIGDGDGLGLEHIFRGQCRWGKYKGNEALIIKGPATKNQERIVLFIGAGKADSFKRLRGMTIGLWIATEINLHHPEMIREALKRQVNATPKKFFWDLNPENPNDYIYTEYIDKWKKEHEDGRLIGGYNYEQFNIDDNINLSPQNIAEFKSQYTPGTVYYKRDILGIRAVAEGLIFQRLADDPDGYFINRENVPEVLASVDLGLDFGKSKSKHGLVAAAVDVKGNIYITRARSVAVTQTGTNGNPVQSLFDWVQQEATLTKIDTPQVRSLYGDSAEPHLISSLRPYANLYCYGVEKLSIKTRIIGVNYLLENKKIFFVRGQTEELVEALTNAVYVPVKPGKTEKEERKDDGSYNNDIIDAFEYAIMRQLKQIVERMRFSK